MSKCIQKHAETRSASERRTKLADLGYLGQALQEPIECSNECKTWKSILESKKHPFFEEQTVSKKAARQKHIDTVTASVKQGIKKAPSLLGKSAANSDELRCGQERQKGQNIDKHLPKFTNTFIAFFTTIYFHHKCFKGKEKKQTEGLVDKK